MKLISNDGQEFEIDEDTAKQSTVLKPFSDGECLNIFLLLNSIILFLFNNRRR